MALESFTTSLGILVPFINNEPKGERRNLLLEQVCLKFGNNCSLNFNCKLFFYSWTVGCVKLKLSRTFYMIKAELMKSPIKVDKVIVVVAFSRIVKNVNRHTV